MSGIKKTVAVGLIVATVTCSCQTNHEERCTELTRQAKYALDEKRAEHLWKQAISEATLSTNRMQLPRSLRACAEFYAAHNQLELAEKAYREAIDAFDKLQSDPEIPKVYLRQNIDEYVAMLAALAKVKQTQKDFRQADSLFKRAIKTNEEQLGNIEERNRIALSYAAMLHDAGRDEEAFDVEVKFASLEYTRRDWEKLSRVALGHLREGESIARKEFAICRTNAVEPIKEIDSCLKMYFWSTICELLNDKPMKALDCVKAMPALRKRTSSVPQAYDLIAQALVYGRVNQPDKARASYTEALRLYPDDTISLVIALGESIKNYKGGTELALNLDLNLLDVARKMKSVNPMTAATFLWNAGDLERRRHRLIEAHKFYLRDWQESQTQKPVNWYRFAAASGRLATVYLDMEQPQNAAKMLDEGAAIAPKILRGRDLNQALMILNMTRADVCYTNLKDFPKVIESSKQAYKYAKLTANKDICSRALWHWADSCKLLGNLAEAEKMFLTEMKLWDPPATTSDKTYLGDSLFRLGDLYRDTARFATAESMYLRHIKLGKEDPECLPQLRKTQVLNRLSETISRQGRLKEGLECAKSALELSTKSKDEFPIEYCVSLYLIGDLYDRMGSPEKGQEYYLTELAWVEKQPTLNSTIILNHSIIRLMNNADTFWINQKKLGAAKTAVLALTAYERNSKMEDKQIEERMHNIASCLRSTGDAEIVRIADDIDRRLSLRAKKSK